MASFFYKQDTVEKFYFLQHLRVAEAKPGSCTKLEENIIFSTAA